MYNGIAFPSKKKHWKHPGVVIAFETTWNLILNSSLENAELGNGRYSQIHYVSHLYVAKPST